MILVELQGALDGVDLGEVGRLTVTGDCTLATVFEATICSLRTDYHRLYSVELQDVHILGHRTPSI